MKPSAKIVVSVMLAVSLLAACGGEEEGIEISNAFATEAALGERGALYFTITNHDVFQDVLEAVSTPAAAVSQIHRTITEGGRSHMERIGGIPIGPDTTIVLKPGSGYHIMLLDLQQRIARGDTLTARLQFRRSGALEIRAPVIAHSQVDSVLEAAGDTSS
jgi:copper(I)-binding protein